MSPATGTIPEAPIHHSPFYKWGGLIILGLALFVIILDTTLLNVSLKPIVEDLNTNLENLQWVITVYSLVLAAFTITGGRLGDLFGKKRMFVLGAILFAVGAFIASASSSIMEMVIGESIIEGIGAALMLPATASLLVSTYKGRDRAIAFGIWGGLAAASTAIGPVLGGWLATHYSWRWGFRLNIVVVIFLLLGTFLIKEGKRPEGKQKLDYIGIIISSLGLSTIVFAFLQTSTYGWFVEKVPFSFFGHLLDLGNVSITPLFLTFGLAMIAMFIWWQYYLGKNGRTQLVTLDLFKNRQFMFGTLTAAILFLSQSGVIFAMPVFLQAAKNFDSFTTGLYLLPMSASLLVSAPLSAFLCKYIEAKRLVLAGVFLSIAGLGVLSYMLKVDSGFWDLAIGFILFGAGMGFIMAQVSNLTLSSVSEEESGEAAGVNNTIRQIGATLGSAIIGSIFISSLTGNIIAKTNASETIPDKVKTNIVQAIKDPNADVEFSGGANLISPANTATKNEISIIVRQSTVEANKKSLAFGMAFLMLGIITALFLTNSRNEEYNKVVNN